MSEEKIWNMPPWMQKYRPHLERLGGGNTVEYLMNQGSKATIFNNAPLALICAQMEAMVSMLHSLRQAKIIQ